MDLLIGLNHRRIAFLGRATGDGDIGVRLAVFRESAIKYGLDMPPGFVVAVENRADAGRFAVMELLDRRPRPTAIVAGTDLIALGCLSGAWQRGVAVPQELSVIGYDDMPIAEYTIPSLTTVRQPIRHLAERALEMLRENRSQWAGEVVLPPELKLRGSHAIAVE
jgi:DNA-binding LacI/PurR family transcriptional regulator